VLEFGRVGGGSSGQPAAGSTGRHAVCRAARLLRPLPGDIEATPLGVPPRRCPPASCRC
jgi:hypothetical protein